LVFGGKGDGEPTAAGIREQRRHVLEGKGISATGVDSVFEVLFWFSQVQGLWLGDGFVVMKGVAKAERTIRVFSPDVQVAVS
jgi:hypothetical protein